MELVNEEYTPNSPKAILAEKSIQIGVETSWLAVGDFAGRPVTLKADGTLWEWFFSQAPNSNPRGYFHCRFDRHSDWVDIAASERGGFIALAADGSLWSFGVDLWDNWNCFTPHALPLLAPSRRPQYLGNIFNATR